MKWGLTQGLIGRQLLTLSPSVKAVGPNTYLSEKDFLKMLGVAFLLHGLAMGVAALMPGEKVTNIPVRALSFKLGDQDKIAAFGAPVAAASAPTPIAPPAPAMAASNDWRASPPPEKQPAPKPKPTPVKQPLVVPIIAPVRTMPAQNPQPSLAPIPAPAQPSTPAIASTPQQYVREVGTPNPNMLSQLPSTSPLTTAGSPNGAIGGQGSESTMTEQTEQAARARYEQQISSWVEQHKLYPSAAGGREGRVVVRMRIDRGGYVRYYALEQTSGVEALDAAALDMIRRANPMPAVPANYPAGNLVEFLIPISFKAPR